jgi:hypothetical protein
LGGEREGELTEAEESWDKELKKFGITLEKGG